jgi:ankyrin repeat protein
MKAARRNKYSEVIEALLKTGANTKAKDKKGKTAVDHAKENEKLYKTKVYWKLNELQYE